MSADRLVIDLGARRDAFVLDVAADISLRGVTALFGPSGSGKTSLLRQIAGFERPDRGEIRCGDETWFDSQSGIDLPPHRRPAGFVFQDARLFPHLDVRSNLDFAARRSDGPIAADAVIAALDLDPLLARRPATLSGGERQRVALGRTLLSQPRLLLLDEPLSALDAQRKAEILPYLERILDGFDLPALYVSHSIDEVAQLADDVLLLDTGRVQAFGAATEILDRYDLEAVTGRFGAGSMVEGVVAGHDARLCLSRVDLCGQALSLPIAPDLEPGARVRLRIRARDIAIATGPVAGLSIRNALSATLTGIRADAASAYAELTLDLDGAVLRARITRAAVEDLELTEGQQVQALIKSVSFEPDLR